MYDCYESWLVASQIDAQNMFFIEQNITPSILENFTVSLQE
jgi:hypothetical protein